MEKHLPKLILTLYAILGMIALVIIADLIIPGKVINSDIVRVHKEREQYYNAARNYHYSYKVFTKDHSFYISEDKAKTSSPNEKIEYSVSRIFKQINWYRLPVTADKSMYSFRILAGLVLPLLSIISIFLIYRYKWNIEILVFVLQVLLIADLVFLLL